MKKILIVLTIIFAVGFVSSMFLAGWNFQAAIDDVGAGFLYLAVFWGIWAISTHFTNKKKKGVTPEDLDKPKV